MIRVFVTGGRDTGRAPARIVHAPARVAASTAAGRGDVFELWVDDDGALELRQLPRYHETGEDRVLYRSTAAERRAERNSH